MKNFKNDLTNKNSNSNRKPHYKAISLASLSTLALTLTFGDSSIANAMMTKTGAVKFYGSNGSRVISGVHSKISSITRPTSIPKVTGDIGGRFNNTGKIGTTSTTSKPTASPVKTYKSILNIQLKGNTSSLGSGGSSQIKKPTTTPTINQNTSTLSNTVSTSTTGKKPTTTTQPNIKYTKDGTPYVTEGGENFIYLKGPNGTTKLNMDFDGNGNAIYYTKNASGTITYLQKVGHDDGGIGDFRPTTNNKPVVSVGTQTDPDITGGKTNTLTSKKPTTPNQSSSNDGKYNATLVELDDDGNIIKPNNSGSPTLKPTQQLDPDGDGTNNNTLTSKRPNTPNQSSSNDGKYNATLVQLDDDGNIIQQNNAGATTSQITTGTGNKKLTKKGKIALGVAGGVAGLGTILGLSIGLTSNGNSNDNKKDDGTPPKLVPVPSAPKYSISVVNSPEGNLFTDN